jgi:hypothetical protein
VPIVRFANEGFYRAYCFNAQKKEPCHLPQYVFSVEVNFFLYFMELGVFVIGNEPIVFPEGGAAILAG